MLKNTSNKIFVGAIALITTIACLGVVNFKPDPSHLGMRLAGEAQGQQKIELYYLEKTEAKGIAFRYTQDLSQAENYYFSYPRHFSPDKVVIDMGVAPSTWRIDDVSVYVDFLLFGVPGYRWDVSAIAELATPNESSTHLTFDDKFHVNAFKDPGRFTFKLDYGKARPTLALMMVKLGCVLTLIGTAILLINGYLWRLFRYRETDLATLENNHTFIHTHRRLWLICGAVLLVSLLLYKLFPHLQSPGLHIEDTMEFSDYSSGRAQLMSPETYEYYRGYYVLISEWLAAAINLLPATWQPHLYVALSSSLLIIAILANAYSGIYASKLVLAIAPPVLFFGAFTDSAFYITLTGTLFSSTVLLMAIAFRPPPSSTTKLLCYVALIAALSWSGPYGSILLPFSVALMLFFGTRRNAVLLAVIAILAVSYIMSAQTGMLQLSNIFDPKVRMVFFRYLVEHILLLDLFPGVGHPIGFVILGAITASLFAFRRDTLFMKMSLILLATGLASFTTYFLSFKFEQYAGEVISSHTVISQLCWLMFLLLCVDRLFNKLSGQLTKAMVATATIGIFGFVLSVKHQNLTARLVLLPDPELKNYLSAVQYAQGHHLNENEFLQLWYVDRLGFVTSYHKGYGSRSVSKSDLPDFVQPYFLAKDLGRQENMMMIYDGKKRVVNVSTKTGILEPIPVQKPTHRRPSID